MKKEKEPIRTIAAGHRKSARLYRDASNAVEQKNLRNFLKRLAERSESFFSQLTADNTDGFSREDGENPAESPALRRIASIPEHFSHQGDVQALKTCLQTERVILAAMDYALRQTILPENLTDIVLSQRNQIYAAVRTLVKLEPALIHSQK